MALRSRSENNTNRRKYDRFATTTFTPVPVSFSGEAQGTGTLYDVSRGGCKIDSRVTPPLGASLTLRLSLSEHAPPLVVDAGCRMDNPKQVFRREVSDAQTERAASLESLS
jgi:PilZ domain-containing protein